MVEKLSLDGLRDRVEKLKAEKFEKARPGLNAVLDEMAREREILLNELKTLAGAEPTEEVHPGLLKAATEARKLLTEKMTRALADIGHCPEFSVTTLATFDGKLTKATNLTTDALIVHGRYVRTVFEPRFAAVQTRLRGLHGTAKQAHTIIEGVIRENSALNSVLSEIGSQKELVQNLGKNRANIESLEGRAKETEEMLEKERDQLTQLVSSEEFKRAADLMRGLDQIKLEISRLESEVVSAFSDLSRPLRKLEKLVVSGGHRMDRELMKTLKLCINSPVDIISSEEKISAAKLLLQETSKLLTERKIDLADRERRKKLEKAQKLASDLDGYKRRLDLLNQQLESQRQLLEVPVQKQAAELERSIGQRESGLRQIRASIEELGHKSKLLRDEIEDRRVKLEKLASDTLGAKIELTS